MLHRKTVKKDAAAAVLLVAAFAVRMIYEDLDNAMLQAILSTVRNTIHVFLLVLWTVSLRRRLLNRNVRRLMLAVGGLMLFWLMDKIVKWDFTGSEYHVLVRYLWYGFYVGMLFVPTLGAFVVDYLGKPEDHRHAPAMNLLLIPPTLMLLAVFTNDLHQKVFVFYNGFYHFNREYGYDWMYFIIMGWFVLMGFYFVVMILVKSRVPGSKKLQKMPIVIMGGAMLFWIGYSMRLYDCDLTATDCLLIVLLLECAIRSGLLPSNSRYRELFAIASIPVRIVDQNGRTHYVSAGAMEVSDDAVKRSEAGPVRLEGALLNSAPIRGGRVVWLDDTTHLDELQQRLQDTVEQLDEENVLLQAELALKKERSRTDEQNRLYDRIAKEVEPQLIKADRLLRQIEEDPAQTRILLAQVCVLGSYIKRRGNLLLLGEASDPVQAKELEYCIRESMENLRLGQVFTSFRSSCQGKLPLGRTVAVFDFYETVVERLLGQSSAMMVDLRCSAGAVCLNLRIGCTEPIAPEILADLTVPCGSYTCEIWEEDVFLDLTVPEGGDAV